MADVKTRTKRQRGVAQAKTQRPPATGALYIAPSPIADVLAEQLDYLITHVSGATCPPGCEDCARFERVAVVLLNPFRKPPAAPTGKRKAA